MSGYDFKNFQDYDPIREAEESERQSQRENFAPQRRSYAERRKALRRKRIINRTIVITAAGLILILIISGISSLFKSCSSNDDNSTDPPTADGSSSEATDEAAEPSVPVDNTQTLGTLDFITPSINDDNTDGLFYSNVYVYKNSGYLSFAGTAEEAHNYAKAILSYKNSLPATVNVYNMIVPSATELCLPKRIAQEKLGADSQADFIKAVYSEIEAEVTPINVYNTLAQHNNEYIYYNTDSHWTALGAYYGYCEFAKTAGFAPVELSALNKKSVADFTGEYAVQTQSPELYSNPDTVDYYDYADDFEITCKIQTSNGEDLQETTLYYPAATSGSFTYGVFIWSDNPLFIIQTANTKSKNILVVKDSYGNPLVPLLANDYDSVHVIDYRRWDGNLRQYCTDNNITDVLFINEIANAARGSQIDTMDTLFN